MKFNILTLTIIQMATNKKKRNCVGFLMVTILLVSINNLSYVWNQILVVYRWSPTNSTLPLEFDGVNSNDDMETDDRMEDEEQIQCKNPFQHIAFIKTHKTGSSTMTSIINRFADIQNLEIALPIKEVRFDWPNQFSHNKVDHTRLKNGKASILCNHLVFNKNEVDRVMKKPYVLITLLRDPAYQFRSLFYFHKMDSLYNFNTTKDPISYFFKNPRQYFRNKNEDEFVYNSELLMKNGMTYDLNYRRFMLQNPGNLFTKFIDFIENSFQLVLITEYFDESLIILKRIMCWGYLDIVYEKKLVNRDIKDNPMKEQLKEKIYNWSPLDYQLYQHFKTKLENIVKEENPAKFKEELYIFRKLNQMINTICIGIDRKNTNKLFKFLETINENLISLKDLPRFCEKLHRDEKEYVEYFREKYRPYYFIRKT